MDALSTEIKEKIADLYSKLESGNEPLPIQAFSVVWNLIKLKIKVFVDGMQLKPDVKEAQLQMVEIISKNIDDMKNNKGNLDMAYAQAAVNVLASLLESISYPPVTKNPSPAAPSAPPIPDALTSAAAGGAALTHSHGNNPASGTPAEHEAKPAAAAAAAGVAASSHASATPAEHEAKPAAAAATATPAAAPSHAAAATATPAAEAQKQSFGAKIADAGKSFVNVARSLATEPTQEQTNKMRSVFGLKSNPAAATAATATPAATLPAATPAAATPTPATPAATLPAATPTPAATLPAATPAAATATPTPAATLPAATPAAATATPTPATATPAATLPAATPTPAAATAATPAATLPAAAATPAATLPAAAATPAATLPAAAATPAAAANEAAEIEKMKVKANIVAEQIANEKRLESRIPPQSRSDRERLKYHRSLSSAAGGGQVGGGISHKRSHPKYMNEISENRNKIFKKELEIISSIRRFHRSHTIRKRDKINSVLGVKKSRNNRNYSHLNTKNTRRHRHRHNKHKSEKHIKKVM